MKPLTIAAAVLLFLYWQRGANVRDANARISEAVPTQPYDYMQTWWHQLNGQNIAPDVGGVGPKPCCF